MRIFITQIDYVPLVGNPGKMKVASYTASVLLNLQAPTTLTKLRLYFRLCDPFKQFLLNFKKTLGLHFQEKFVDCSQRSLDA